MIFESFYVNVILISRLSCLFSELSYSHVEFEEYEGLCCEPLVTLFVVLTTQCTQSLSPEDLASQTSDPQTVCWGLSEFKY